MQYLVLKWKTTEPRLRKSVEDFAPFFCLNLAHCKEVLGPFLPQIYRKNSSRIPIIWFWSILWVYKKYIEGKNISCFEFDIFLCWKILKGLDLHKIEPLFLEISVGGNLVLSISQRLFSGSLPLMKPCISIEGKRKHCLLTHLQS